MSFGGKEYPSSFLLTHNTNYILNSLSTPHPLLQPEYKPSLKESSSDISRSIHHNTSELILPILYH